MKKLSLVCISLTLCAILGACACSQDSTDDASSPEAQGSEVVDAAGEGAAGGVAGGTADEGDAAGDAAAENAAGEGKAAEGNAGEAADEAADTGNVAPGESAAASGVQGEDQASGQVSSQADEGFFCTIYALNDNVDGLVCQEKTIESSSAWHIWAALKRANPSIPIDAGLNSYTVAQGVGFLDLKEGIYGMNVGSGVESLLFQAIANTYIENTDASKVMIRVEGETYESGHLYLDEPIDYRAL